jgi:hypothetical protein
MAGLDVLAKRKIPAPVDNQTLVIYPVASHYTDGIICDTDCAILSVCLYTVISALRC